MLFVVTQEFCVDTSQNVPRVAPSQLPFLFTTLPKLLTIISFLATIMPWSPKGSYAEHKNAELSQMLKQRGLAGSGTKAQLCARLIANDATQ